MHIGFLSIESPFDTTRGGGISAYLRALIPGLVQAGHQVTVVANGNTYGFEYMYEGSLTIAHVRLPGLHWYLSKVPLFTRNFVLPLRQIEWSFGFYRLAQRVFAKRPVDILETAETGTLLTTRWPFAPTVVRLHGSDYVFKKYAGEPICFGDRLNHFLEKTSWKRAQAITAPSQFQAAEAAHEMSWTADKIHVIPNPIVQEILIETEHVSGLGNISRDESRPIVLYVGRLAPVKGILPLLEAADIVTQSFEQIRFLLIGPWQMSKKPEELNLERTNPHEAKNISWLGHLSWNELPQWYRRAAIFVMPSYFESFGISCIEAMAFGLPVVATLAGGLPEVVEDGVTGILVPPGDPQALAGAIIRLLRDPVLRQQMGRTGRERVLTEYTAERVTEQTLAVYHDVQRKSVLLHLPRLTREE